MSFPGDTLRLTVGPLKISVHVPECPQGAWQITYSGPHQGEEVCTFLSTEAILAAAVEEQLRRADLEFDAEATYHDYCERTAWRIIAHWVATGQLPPSCRRVG